LLLDASLEERIKVVRAAVDKNPRAADGWRVLAQLYRDAGNNAAAYEALSTLLSLDETDREARYVTAVVAFESGRYADAAGHFEHCLRQGYRRVDCLFNLALLKELGSDGRRHGSGADIAAAQVYYQQLLQIDPRHATSLYNLAYLHLVLAQKQPAGSRAQYEHIKAEVVYFDRYIANAPPEEDLRKQSVSEQVAQHRRFLLAWEEAHKD
jgi:tetratricopeptide (TPR) repeat protein